MATTLTTRRKPSQFKAIPLSELATRVEVHSQQPTVTDQQIADLKSRLQQPFYTVRSGIKKTVYLVGVGKRKVTLKRNLEAVDSFQEPIEKFLRFYKPS